MSTNTTNYGLVKPTKATDNADIGVVNSNMDIIDTQLKVNADNIGDMSTVPTTSKIVSGAITELFQSVSDGKTLVAAAITGKGVPTAATDPFATMASNIGSIVLGSGDALPGDVRAGRTFSNDSGTGKVGTIPVRATGPVTAVTADIILPAGIYDAPITVKGDPDKVTANIKAGITIDGVPGKAQVVDTTTAAGATAAQMLAGRKGFVNGTEVTGVIVDRAGDTAAISSSVVGTVLKLLASIGFRDGVDDYVTITDADYIAANILNTANIFGLLGTFAPTRIATGTTTTSGTVNFNITGIGFDPKVALLVKVGSGTNFLFHVNGTAYNLFDNLAVTSNNNSVSNSYQARDFTGGFSLFSTTASPGTYNYLLLG
jgi:hypothetical protein